MQLGEYFIVAGTIVRLVFPTTTGQEIAAFLTQIGTGLAAGQGTVGPIKIGSVTATISFTETPATPSAQPQINTPPKA